MEDLFFHFGDSETGPGRHGFVLGPLNLHFRPGEVVNLTGGNGSGKTTLAKLLACLYVPTSGKLFYNDTLIDASNLDRY